MSQERTSQEKAVRRRILQGALGAATLAGAPFIKIARAQGKPIKIGIPTVITGGYALLGSQVMRTCRLVQNMVNAKGGVIGRPVQFLFQDTQATRRRACANRRSSSSATTAASSPA